MKLVYTAESLIDAQLIMDLLRNNGVPCLLFNQNAVGGFGELPMTHPEVWVQHDRDAAAATREIEHFETSPTPATNKPCPNCREFNPATFEVCWRCDAPLAG